MGKYFFLLMMLLFVSSYAQDFPFDDDSFCPEGYKFVDEHFNDFRFSYRKGSIPRSVRTAFKENYEERFRIANPGRSYAAGCVRKLLEPHMQLIFAARYNDYFIMAFHRGGRGLHIACVIAQFSKKELNALCYTTYSDAEVPTAFKEMIRDKSPLFKKQP